MAEPGDPSNPDDHDDLIGFASAASLQGHLRERPAPEPVTVLPEPAPAPLPAPAPAPALSAEVVSLQSTSRPRTEPPLTARPAAPAAATVEAGLDPEPPVTAPIGDRPVEAGSIFEPSREFSTRARSRKELPGLPGGGMSLFSVYALILFAVPTLGVSAVLGLLAVTGRPPPADPVSQSHFIYQRRTLWIAAVATVAGLILLVAAPFAMGVPTLFFVACWLVVRGASGVWDLRARRPVAHPLGWWI